MKSALYAARERVGESLDDLLTEIAIPSVSTDPDHSVDCERNALFLEDKLRGLGFKTQQIPGPHPVVFAELNHLNRAPTVTIYGHYDVQPPDPIGEWKTDPFKPSVVDGLITARGSADSKGNHMAAIKAVEYCLAASSLPVNIKFFIEGEEETGGETLSNFLRANEVSTDCVLLLDGGFTADDQPALYAGLRGLLYAEVEVTGPSHDVHSGQFGGVAPNPCLELGRLLGTLHDLQGAIALPGFYDDVVDVPEAERSRWHEPEDFERRILQLTGASALVGEARFGIIERLWARPTLDVVGMSGGFTGYGQKTIIASKAFAKVSCRLVSGQDPDAVFQILEKELHSRLRPGFSLKVAMMSKCSPVSIPLDSDAVHALSEACEQAFGVSPKVVRAGGSIPVASAFQEFLDAPLLITGLAHSTSRVHSPNESLRVSNYLQGIEMLIGFFHNFAKENE